MFGLGLLPAPLLPHISVLPLDIHNSKNCSKGLAEAGKTQAAVAAAKRDWLDISTAASNHGIPPQFLAAIGIRETGFVNEVQNNWPYGLGAGIYQIDVGQNPDVSMGQAFDPAWAANYAVNMLESNMGYLRRYNFNYTQLLQATAASYNFGTGNIHGNPAKIDVGTTHGNYGSDVLLLMDCF